MLISNMEIRSCRPRVALRLNPARQLWEDRMKRFGLLTSAVAAIVAAAGSSFAADKFPGVTIDAKLIGGQQYEPLYVRIAEWEKLTGAKVNILSKKSHFEIDKELKSDIAAGNISWCVGYNHTSFAPQYTSLYTDLSKIIP